MVAKKAKKMSMSNEMKTGEVILPLYKIMYTLVLIIVYSSGLQHTGTVQSKVQTSTKTL